MKWLSRILHHLSFQNEKFYSQAQEGSSWFVFLTPSEQRVWRNSWQVLDSLLSHQWDGKGQVSGSMKGLGASFRYLNCHILVFGLLGVAFGGKSKGWKFLGGKPYCTLGELSIITGAGWRQSMATMPGGGTDIPGHPHT